MDPVQAPASRKRIPNWLIPSIGYTISAVSLIWVFTKFPFHQLGDDVRTLTWGWVALAIIFDFFANVCDGWRLGILLNPAERLPIWECLQAVYVGLFASKVLPAKAGEVVRCYLLSYWGDIPLALTLTAGVIVRIMDGVWLVVLYYLVTIGIHNVPRWLSSGMDVVSLCVLGLSALFLYVLFRRSHAHTWASGNRWASKFVHVLDELHKLGNRENLLRALGVSFLYFALQMLFFWALFKAYHFDFGVKDSSFVLIVIHLGTMVPNAPGNIGSLQFFCESALKILSAEANSAVSFSTIMFVFLTLPQLIGGAIAVALTGFNIQQLHQHAREAHHRPHASRK